MLLLTQWKSRPLSREQANRMMDVWGKLEARMAENTSFERVGWWLYSDASGGAEVLKVSDPDAAAAFELEASLALGEFLEFDSHIVLDLDSAMGPIMKAVEQINA